MTLNTHCKACDNSIFDFKLGVACGLTNQKPDFKHICPNKIFHTKIQQVIVDVNEDVELTKEKKSLSYANFLVFLTIGISIMIGSFIFGQFIYDKGFISTVPLLIFFIGIAFIPKAFGPVNKYNQDILLVTQTKNELDKMLSLYGVSYEIKTHISKDVHGNVSAKSDLKINTQLPPSPF